MKTRTLAIILTALSLIACNETFTIGMEHIPAGSATPPPTATALPPTSSPAASPTAAITPIPTLPLAVVPPSPIQNYIDDRSTPSQVIVSYYNALNRQEYLRAYNYWLNPTGTQGSFTRFVSGYKDTARVDLVFGSITSGVGAGQIYYTVPVLLKATARNGVRANWAACYIVHQARPENFGEPPFISMGIDRGSASPYDLLVDDVSALAAACTGFPSGDSPAAVYRNPLNIDKSNFLDDRSGPLETVSSLLNALNRKEYVRAYSYYQNPAVFPGPYDPYAAGYADTGAITAVFGTLQSQAAAGHMYYKQPLAMHVQKTDGTTQTYVGCYALHLAQPAGQSTPPFQPMGITGGSFKAVDNNADINTLLASACP